VPQTTIVMASNKNIRFSFLISFSLLFLSFSCDSNDDIIVDPVNGYEWPSQERSYWPTNGWQLSDMENHGVDASKMETANQFAQNDPLSRALLVIKDGYIVYENYYGDGGVDQSTNLWSVTKSFSSALIGILIDEHTIGSTNELMSELLPAYPEFNDITLHHVLTMTTGLAWAESGPLWTDWILSDDWVAAALERGQIHKAGKKWKYSSGNSHFLTSLAYYKTNESPGKIANDHLFEPMGMLFEPMDPSIMYTSWNEYLIPLHQTWTRDSKGIETASFGLFLTARDMAKFGFLYLNKGKWGDRQLISEEWATNSTKDHVTNIYGRYSYGYQWYITLVDGHPSFLASGFGGQIIGIVPDLDLVVVLKYEAENPTHPEPGTSHDDMYLFELVVKSVH